MTTTKINVYDMVGKQILEIMNSGIIPWKQPWIGTDAYMNYCQTDGIAYEKVNHGFRYDRTADELINDYTTANSIEVISNPDTIRACYSPTQDRIEIPRVERFACLEEYYGTLFHEAVHSTGKDTRLNRLHKTAAFGNEEYSKEELVAEIGSAALLNMVGLSTEQTTENSAAYIQSWSRFIRENTRAFVSACGQADKVVEFIKNFS